MKTFSEAVEATMMRRKVAGSPGDDQVVDEIRASMEPYESLHAEIQNSPEAAAFATGLLDTSPDELDGDDLFILLLVAFSHGVMVGIEMEKAPLLVGREPSDVPPDSTEANPEKYKCRRCGALSSNWICPDAFCGAIADPI